MRERKWLLRVRKSDLPFLLGIRAMTKAVPQPNTVFQPLTGPAGRSK